MGDPEVSNSDPNTPTPTVVVAMGGHAFMLPGERGTHEQAVENARAICAGLMVFVDRGYNVVLTHGNGPQVGDLLAQVERTREHIPPRPLDVLVAETEGSLGYLLQRALLNELRQREVRRYVVTVITQVLVDKLDPAFAAPAKPVGPSLSEGRAKQREAEDGWVVKLDGKRGWRRVVASPRPIKVIQRHMIREAAHRGHIVIAAGGGGVPVTKDPSSDDYIGVEAVIDKDLTSSVLATDVRADLLVILTAVDGVYLNWGQPNESRLGAVTMAECRRYIDEGHFPAGSMGPKVEAIYGFMQRGGKRGLITDIHSLADALDGRAGTHFVGRI
ncbi:Carbamate kinase 1 [Enhygromyxa salina]|uniref:Carbamate kinase n=1 Tax=Enhygromyxa salina TaxID=215803 RepID=A0A2S9Y4L3_9BACT|nr:carbamate kinase [Enhygromyxa salina]PRQ00035.1 Carbamate kinase 1 [Enhygromyxa salina]